MQFIIRPTRITDYEAVCGLYEEGDAFHQQALLHLIRLATPARSLDFFKGYLDNDQAHILVAESSGQLLGLVEFRAVVVPERPIILPRSFVSVDSLIVREDARHQGVGRALMKAVEEWAQENGFTEIELNVHEFNQGAIEFYAKSGYATVSRRMMKSLEW